jgi:SAM-dependent methyltransferase
LAWEDGRVVDASRGEVGSVFNKVAELYDRMRPSYPEELFVDLAAIADLRDGSAVLEVGCGTGQATAGLTTLGCSVTAVEPGLAMAALAHQKFSDVPQVQIETATFEQWEERGRTFDALVAAASWHWVDPSIGWRKAHRVVCPGGWMALIGHVVVRNITEPEVYAQTADLHEQFAPGNPAWGHPPLEADVRATDSGWGPDIDPGGLFGDTIVRWYPTVQWFDGNGFADLLRTTSLYRPLEPDVREPLLDAIAERIRNQMGDRVARRHLCGMRIGQRSA